MNFIIYALACIAAHRIWNFEEVFQRPRNWLLRYPGAKWITCQVCNAFWVCLAVGLMTLSTASSVFIQALAAYSVVRAALWSYRIASHAEGSLKKTSITIPYAPAPAKDGNPPVAMLSMADFTSKKCTSCEQKRNAVQSEMSRVSPYERRVVLLTTLSSFSPSYSVATCILDQARMLAAEEKWLVQIWIHEKANLSELPADLPPNVEVRQIIPQVPWKDDAILEEYTVRLAGAVRENLIKLGNATVITHDVMFVSSYTTFAAAVHRIGDTPGFGWLHVCHSAVGSRPRYSSLDDNGPGIEARTSIPKEHRLLCLNRAEAPHLAAYYEVPPERVLVCSNARDITAFGNFDKRAAQLIDDHALGFADVVQVYPVSATRMKDKGVGTVIDIMGWLHRNNGLSCKLVLVTAHANGAAEKAALAAYRSQAIGEGLPPDFLVVTSDDFPDTASNGLPQAAVRDLFSVSNLFIFPTVSEASSLVLVEAALSGCLLVTNKSLHTVTGSALADHALEFPFGSLRTPEAPTESVSVANAIADNLGKNKANRGKRRALRVFNFSTIGRNLRDCVEETPFISLPK